MRTIGVNRAKRPVDLPPHNRPLEGRLAVPPSKSMTNRALVLCAVANGGTVHDPLACEDTEVLSEALTACGWTVVGCNGSLDVGERRPLAEAVRVDLRDSGTGSRFMVALTGVTAGEVTIDGTARLRERPMAPLLDALGRLGVVLEAERGHLPVTVRGARVAGGELRLAPRTSSQFVSALLLVAPLMKDGLELHIEGQLPSAPYLDLTESVLREFGGRIESRNERRRWRVESGGVRPTEYRVEGDWSAAAFPLSAVAVCAGRVTLTNLRDDSAQGDRMILGVLERAGCGVVWGEDGVTVTGPATGVIRADLTDAPDLFPALSVVAACGEPGSEITGLGTLQYKESNRLLEMERNLGRLGAELHCGSDVFRVVRPVCRRRTVPVDVNAAGDHRVAMAMAVAALRGGPVRLDDSACVVKSYPGFWRDWSRLKGRQ